MTKNHCPTEIDSSAHRNFFVDIKSAPAKSYGSKETQLVDANASKLPRPHFCHSDPVTWKIKEREKTEIRECKKGQPLRNFINPVT